ncbi:hypothetical protein [Sulfurovum sp.]|uniref:hypothetical protein n=1 Tax=Sulfurovum sp. TaxID=1969726 RepID=UPI0025EC1AD8|nr:hypothetical protein [Sulfurovum sp.]
MKKIFHGILALVAIMALSGCANKVHDYSVSTNNLLALKTISGTANKVNLGEFTDSGRGERSTMCRLATPIGTPKGETFASYIQNALKKELIISDMFDENAKRTITANLDKIYGSTVIGNAFWEFAITLKSSNGLSYKVNSRYDYESSFSAMSACSEMQRSFPLAVQKLIGEIVKNPKFVALSK